jgi:hypothetical protein
MKNKNTLLKHFSIRTLVASVVMASCLQAVAADDKPCQGDAQKLCPGMKIGQGLGKCLADHQDQLSDGCKAKFKENKDKMKEAIAKCEADKKKFCPDTQPGEGRILKCLQEHAAQLSADCKSQLKSP